MFSKNKNRYTIQVKLTNEEEWKHFYSERPTRSIQNALGALYAWRGYKWDFTSEKPKFRIYDNRLDEVKVDREAKAMLELGVDLIH